MLRAVTKLGINIEVQRLKSCYIKSSHGRATSGKGFPSSKPAPVDAAACSSRRGESCHCTGSTPVGRPPVGRRRAFWAVRHASSRRDLRHAFVPRRPVGPVGRLGSGFVPSRRKHCSTNRRCCCSGHCPSPAGTSGWCTSCSLPCSSFPGSCSFLRGEGVAESVAAGAGAMAAHGLLLARSRRSRDRVAAVAVALVILLPIPAPLAALIALAIAGRGRDRRVDVLVRIGRWDALCEWFEDQRRVALALAYAASALRSDTSSWIRAVLLCAGGAAAVALVVSNNHIAPIRGPRSAHHCLQRQPHLARVPWLRCSRLTKSTTNRVVAEHDRCFPSYPNRSCRVGRFILRTRVRTSVRWLFLCKSSCLVCFLP